MDNFFVVVGGIITGIGFLLMYALEGFGIFVGFAVVVIGIGVLVNLGFDNKFGKKKSKRSVAGRSAGRRKSPS